jgi:hypothetical protein
MLHLHQIPPVTVKVEEHDDRTECLPPRLLHERDLATFHLIIVAPEVFRMQEKEHPAARLIADPALLLRGRGPGQEQSGPATARWGDKDPPLPLAQRRILDQGEPQAAREEGNRLVVVPHQESDNANGLRHAAVPLQGASSKPVSVEAVTPIAGSRQSA